MNIFSSGGFDGSGEGDSSRSGDPIAVGNDVGWVSRIDVGCSSLLKEMAVWWLLVYELGLRVTMY